LLAIIIIIEAEMLPVYEKNFCRIKRVGPTDENAFTGAKFG